MCNFHCPYTYRHLFFFITARNKKDGIFMLPKSIKCVLCLPPNPSLDASNVSAKLLM